MPIYEYRCKSCERTIEVIQRFSDRPLRKCQHCSGRLEKLISRTSFQLKGGGWFAQGYGGDGPSKKPAKAKDKAKASKKKETKSSAKD